MRETTAACPVYAVHDRHLAIATDDQFVARFIREAYGGAGVPTGRAAPHPDRGEIVATGAGYRLRFNGADRAWPIPQPGPGDAFLAAFYGSRELFRLSAARVESCRAIYGAAVACGPHAVLLLGASGSGKTTLALALVQHGALLYGDECIFVDKRTGATRGLARGLMVRASAFEPLSDIQGLRAACAAGPLYAEGDVRLWYAVDPGRIFNRDVGAPPLPLRTVILLGERAAQPAIATLPNSLARLTIAQHSHAKAAGLDALASEHDAFREVACYRVNAGPPAQTAALILRTLADAA
jgi:hypothetical protein